MLKRKNLKSECVAILVSHSPVGWLIFIAPVYLKAINKTSKTNLWNSFTNSSSLPIKNLFKKDKSIKIKSTAYE